VLEIYAVIGTLLAIGFAARDRSAAVRALAAASTVSLVTLYFTFDRGVWIDLGLALVTLVVLDSRQLQLVTTFAVVTQWPAAEIAARPVQSNHDIAVAVRLDPDSHRPSHHLPPSRATPRTGWPGHGCVGQGRKLLSGHTASRRSGGGRQVQGKPPRQLQRASFRHRC
jgi:hypothetical protein